MKKDYTPRRQPPTKLNEVLELESRIRDQLSDIRGYKNEVVFELVRGHLADLHEYSALRGDMDGREWKNDLLGPEDLFLGSDDCKGPLAICVYDEVHDPCHDHCLFCMEPEERK